MATQAEHKTKWLHNRAFLGTVGDDYADWMVAVMFYAALHAVETLFAHDKMRVHASHTERNQTLKNLNRYKKIWHHYRPLYETARTARYDPAPADWIPAEEVKSRLVGHLYGLEKSVLKLAGLNGTLGPVWESGR